MFHAISLQTAGNITVTKNTLYSTTKEKALACNIYVVQSIRFSSLLIDLPSLIVLAQITDQKTFNIISHFNEHS